MNPRALALIACAAASPAARADMVFTSGPAQVALIELYTSEGCSSCPPAEKWLGELRGDARLWNAFVPVAFHVDYWDRLGWRDVFASRAFTDRQYAYASAWKSGSVYTPCFVRDGREWRTRDLRVAARDAGVLKLEHGGSDRWHVTFQPSASPQSVATEFEVHLALLGGGLASNVRAGENSGHTLAHEFVALKLTTAPLGRDGAGAFAADATLAVEDARPTPRRAVAAWVSRRGELAPVQAVGGWLE